MEVSFRFAVRTDLGTVRTNNEDSALASERLLVLADGMGGHAAGEVASAVAARVFSQVGEADDDADVATRLTHAGRSTRAALHEMSDADPLLESMGTTLLAVVSDGARVTVGHIGDSRVYALRDSSLYQVTTDHTHVQRLVDTGQLTPEKARTHPYRAMLLRSLDDQPNGPDLDVIDLEIHPGDRLLLCSDGLSDYLPADDIGELLALHDRDEAAEALVDAALRIGTRDNVTVVVADVVPEAADGAPPELVGAVQDGLDLSPLASDALARSLPALAPLIVRSVSEEEDPGDDGEAATADDGADVDADAPVDLDVDQPAESGDGHGEDDADTGAEDTDAEDADAEDTGPEDADAAEGDDAEGDATASGPVAVDPADAATPGGGADDAAAVEPSDAAEPTDGDDVTPAATTTPAAATGHGATQREPLTAAAMAAALLVVLAVVVGLML